MAPKTSSCHALPISPARSSSSLLRANFCGPGVGHLKEGWTYLLPGIAFLPLRVFLAHPHQAPTHRSLLSLILSMGSQPQPKIPSFYRCPNSSSLCRQSGILRRILLLSTTKKFCVDIERQTSYYKDAIETITSPRRWIDFPLTTFSFHQRIKIGF